MKKITSVGEILFDIYHDKKTMGGAPFNFIYHIRKITGEGNFISRIGNDSYGTEILKFLDQNNIPADYVQIDGELPTGTAIANLDENKVPVWTIKENTAYDNIILTTEAEKLVNEYTDCLYFGTLAQRSKVSRETINSLFGRTKKYFCDLNIRQDYYTSDVLRATLGAADVLKLNLEELDLINKTFFQDDFKPDRLTAKLMDRFNIKMIAVTKGADGAEIFSESGSSKCKIEVRNIQDTVGAGDAYAAVMCLGYLYNWEPERINITATDFSAGITKIKGALPADNSFYDTIKKAFENDS